MLQIPSSALSLVSSSRVVFALGAHVAFSILLSGFFIPKDSFVATGTTELFLPPTKCVPSPGPVAFPYIAAMAYKTFIFASLFCILRTKGFSSVGKQPPSPPPESSCSTAKTPRHKSWGWLIWLIAIILVLAGGVGVYTYFTGYDSRHVLTPWASSSRRIFFWIERCYLKGCAAAASCISAVKNYVSQHSKILLIALSTHLHPQAQLDHTPTLVVLFIDGSIRLPRNFDHDWHCAKSRLDNISLGRIASCLSLSLHYPGFNLASKQMPLPPRLVHLHHHLLGPDSDVFLFVKTLPPDAKQTLWNSFSFTRRAQRETRIVLRQVVWHYEDWKAAQLEEFHELTAGLPNTLLKAWCGIWSHLHPIHKLIIVAPAVIFYGYFYFDSVAYRKVAAAMRAMVGRKPTASRSGQSSAADRHHGGRRIQHDIDGGSRANLPVRPWDRRRRLTILATSKTFSPPPRRASSSKGGVSFATLLAPLGSSTS
ncbi:hypothetical protein B0H17DRAFT_1129665 [Mycena rosella]|uniref:Uncharacterized protein n=1 Tax=Mycena rosella TaxID=1033263 RepID=A0AAD7DUJ4_MYCRO|nr:hypothetical protein B0H17DRAFT_1129665 [Mycena rosella]